MKADSSTQRFFTLAGILFTVVIGGYLIFAIAFFPTWQARLLAFLIFAGATVLFGVAKAMWKARHGRRADTTDPSDR